MILNCNYVIHESLKVKGKKYRPLSALLCNFVTFLLHYSCPKIRQLSSQAVSNLYYSRVMRKIMLSLAELNGHRTGIFLYSITQVG